MAQRDQRGYEMSAADAMTDDVIVPPAPAPARAKRRFNLDDLLGDTRPQAVGVQDLPTAKEIRLERIQGDPDQPRRTFDQEKLAELTDSIRIEGVLQPIVVRYDNTRDIYVVVHGERRLRACRAAGLATVPAIVRDVPEDRRLVQQLMENIVRDDLNALDRAAALKALKTQMREAPWDDVAAAVGIRKSRLFQLLGTARLPEAIQADIRSGRISEKQSRALQGLPDEQQRALRDVIVGEGLPADQALMIARRLKADAVPDELDAAAVAIARIRRDLDRPVERRNVAPVETDPELDPLLAALGNLTSGGRAARVSLQRMADWNGFDAFDADRLLDEIYALAQSLTRLAEIEAHDPSVDDRLRALRTALTAVLGK
jgi:ParB family chromosome partitioning protein